MYSQGKPPSKPNCPTAQRITQWIRDTEDEEWLIFGFGLIFLSAPIAIMIAQSP